MPDITIHTSLLFDPKLKEFRENISITVNQESGLICSITTRKDDADDISSSSSSSSPSPQVIDLRGKVVMPGFVDAHTHIFLHAYSEADNQRQKRDESIPERIIRATNHCRAALLAGYTTYRDLGSENMATFDANVRDAIARGLTPGPRLLVATRVLASTGTLALRTENAANGHVLPDAAGPDVVDGVLEARKAVRRRIAEGADIIKVFVDYRRRIMRQPPAQAHPYQPSVLHPSKVPNPDVVSFSQDEVDAIVAEARMAGCPVSAHAHTKEGALLAVRAGVDTLEHVVVNGDEEVFAAMKEKGVILVPTLSVLEKLQPAEKLTEILGKVKTAWDMGVRIACGGDTGTFSHGDNAREMELLVQSGIPLVHVLEMCLVGGWESCGGDLCGRRFGWWEEGCQADIIALDGDPRDDQGALRQVSFVMKDARVWKQERKPVGML